MARDSFSGQRAVFSQSWISFCLELIGRHLYWALFRQMLSCFWQALSSQSFLWLWSLCLWSLYFSFVHPFLTTAFCRYYFLLCRLYSCHPRRICFSKFLFTLSNSEGLSCPQVCSTASRAPSARRLLSYAGEALVFLMCTRHRSSFALHVRPTGRTRGSWAL